MISAQCNMHLPQNYGVQTRVQSALYAQIQAQGSANNIGLVYPVSCVTRYHARFMVAGDLGLGDPISQYLLGEEAA